MGQISVSIVMPCLNEEKNVREALLSSLKAMDRLKLDGEVIVVNDGSRDSTQTIVEELMSQERRIRLINHDSPQGIGASFWEGAIQARRDFVTMIPGDNENDAAEILSYAPLAEQVDIIVPFVQNLEIRSYFRRVVSSIYRLILNVSFGMNLNYTNGTVMYRASLLRQTQLDSKGFFFQAELLVRLIRQGYLYAEVPYFLNVRAQGNTKAISLRSLGAVMSGYLRLAWNVHMRRSAGRADILSLSKDSAAFRRPNLFKSGEDKA